MSIQRHSNIVYNEKIANGRINEPKLPFQIHHCCLIRSKYNTLFSNFLISDHIEVNAFTLLIVTIKVVSSSLNAHKSKKK